MGLILKVIAIILAVAGVITLLSGSIIAGIVLIVLACVVGPGGYSLARR